MRPIILSAATSGSTSSWPGLGPGSSDCRRGRSWVSASPEVLAEVQKAKMAGTTAYSGTQETAPAWTAWAFASTAFLGAFLLFQVQPLISKFILPWFGGAPAVWTTCVLFFQIVLFAGYTYSHLLVGRLSTRSQAMAQCLLLLAAIVVLPIAPSTAWKPTNGSAPTAQILLLLTATVGLPYFVLSTTSPVIQAWFSRS